MTEDSTVFEEEIRGQELRIEYNPQTHSARFEIPGLQLNGDIENELEEHGVYTRVESVDNHGDEWVELTLKPAASVELRDSSGVLRRRPIGNPTDGSVITKQRNSYRYSATAPISSLKKLGVGEKASVSLYLSVDDGTLVFTVRNEDKPHSLMARCESGGLVHLPSAVGAAADLDGHAVDWTYDEDANELVGRTSAELEEVDVSEETTGQHVLASIAQKTQEVERDDDSWTQEHFQTYIRSGHAERLGWTDGQLVDLNLAYSDGDLLLVLKTNLRDGYTENTPCVKRLNAYAKSKEANEGTQLNLYLPNAIVYSMGFDSGTIRWAVLDDKLAGWNPR